VSLSGGPCGGGAVNPAKKGMGKPCGELVMQSEHTLCKSRLQRDTSDGEELMFIKQTMLKERGNRVIVTVIFYSGEKSSVGEKLVFT